MSRAAEDYVDGCTHPELTGVARELLRVIAQLVPEGYTTTPAIAMGDLAARARLHRRTVWTRLDTLVAIGELRIVDGGQGRPARYTLVHLDGVPPSTAAPLPLRADLQPVPLAPRRQTDTPDLFSEPVVRSDSEELVIAPITRITSWRLQTITRITSWAARTITRITSWRNGGEELVIGTCDPCDLCYPDRSDDEELVIGTCDRTLPLDVGDARARDVHTFKELHTPATAEADAFLWQETGPKPVPCRFRGTVHAWCAGRVHVPTVLHREFLAKQGRVPGETDAAHEARLFAFYARTCAALPASEPIADNDFKFWRRAFAAAFASAARPISDRGAAPADGSTCPHQPRCRTERDCIARVLEDGRAARERKSG